MAAAISVAMTMPKPMVVSLPSAIRVCMAKLIALAVSVAVIKARSVAMPMTAITSMDVAVLTCVLRYMVMPMTANHRLAAKRHASGARSLPRALRRARRDRAVKALHRTSSRSIVVRITTGLTLLSMKSWRTATFSKAARSSGASAATSTNNAVQSG